MTLENFGTDIESILLIGGSGYIGKNFNSIFSKIGINVKVLDLRYIENFSLSDFNFIIDLSMLGRNELSWVNKSINKFQVNHDLLLNKIKKNEKNYIRISSVFDIRSFARNDDYTKLSKQISVRILDTLPNLGKIVYAHAIYGGQNSTSFIDNAILYNKFSAESIRDYVHIDELAKVILQILGEYKMHPREIEIGTARPYLSKNIQQYLLDQSNNTLDVADPKSLKFQQLEKNHLVCSAIQGSIQGVSKILADDKIISYLARSKSI
jgi:hypothetical protein